MVVEANEKERLVRMQNVLQKSVRIVEKKVQPPVVVEDEK